MRKNKAKGELKLMKVYFLRTNACNSVILTDGNTAKIFDCAPSGFYEGIDLYSDNAARKISEYFSVLKANGELENYENIFCRNEIDCKAISEELANAEPIFES